MAELQPTTQRAALLVDQARSQEDQRRQEIAARATEWSGIIRDRLPKAHSNNEIRDAKHGPFTMREEPIRDAASDVPVGYASTLSVNGSHPEFGHGTYRAYVTVPVDSNKYAGGAINGLGEKLRTPLPSALPRPSVGFRFERTSWDRTMSRDGGAKETTVIVSADEFIGAMQKALDLQKRRDQADIDRIGSGSQSSTAASILTSRSDMT